MTKKRFIYNLHRGIILDNGKEIMPHEAMKLLNEFDEKYFDEYALRETLQQELQRVENENEQLKKEKDYYKRELQKELVCQAIIDRRESMTENKRFILDDCGTVIDVQTRDTFDYVSEVVDLLNEQHEQIQDIQKIIDKKTKGKWKPLNEKYANDRFMITHTGYLVDTKTDNVFLTIQAFLNFVNKELI